MTNQIFKNKILIILILLILLSIALFVLNRFKNIQYLTVANRSLSANNKFFGANFKRYDFVKLQNLNPIDQLVSPTFTYLIDPGNDIELGGYIIKYNNSIILNDDYKLNSKDIISFYVKNKKYNFEQLQSLVKSNDITITKPDNIAFGSDTTSSYTNEDSYFDEVEDVSKYNTIRTKGSILSDYTNAKLNMTEEEYALKFSFNRIDRITPGLDLKDGLTEGQTLLNDPLAPKAKFISLFFDKGLGGDTQKENRLKGISIITKERKIIKLEVKSDGTFDFESIISQLK